MLQNSKKQVAHFKKLKRIQNLVMDKNMLTKHDIFSQFSGHVGVLQVQLHRNGWSQNDNPVTFYIKMDVNYKLCSEDKVIKSSVDRCLAFLEKL